MVVESLLFTHPHPLSLANFAQIMEGDADRKAIRDVLDELVAEYAGAGRSFRLVEVGEGYQFRTNPECAEWIRRLKKVKPEKLSQAAMETLALLAYRQPTVKAEIEQVRGVDSGWVLNTLLEKGLIRILGRKDVPGRPLVYGTTRKFLELFGLRDLRDLPTLEELEPFTEGEG